MVVLIVVHRRKNVRHVSGVNGLHMVSVLIIAMAHKHAIVLEHAPVQHQNFNTRIARVPPMRPCIAKVVLNVHAILSPEAKPVKFNVQSLLKSVPI